MDRVYTCRSSIVIWRSAISGTYRDVRFLFHGACYSRSLCRYPRISSDSSTQMACGRKHSYWSGRVNAQYWLRPGPSVGHMQRRLVQAITSPCLFGGRGRDTASFVGPGLLLGRLLTDPWALSGIE